MFKLDIEQLSLKFVQCRNIHFHCTLGSVNAPLGTQSGHFFVFLLQEGAENILAHSVRSALFVRTSDHFYSEFTRLPEVMDKQSNDSRDFNPCRKFLVTDKFILVYPSVFLCLCVALHSEHRQDFATAGNRFVQTDGQMRHTNLPVTINPF